MSSYKFDSIVSRSEAEALKEMIFKRARERAESLNTEIQSNFVSDIHNDVMDIARDSFSSTRNPFAPKTEVIAEVEEKPVKAVEKEEIGFPKRQVETIKAEIEYRNRSAVERIISQTTETNMAEARNDFYNKKSFTGALNFLNAQASMLLVENKGKKFEAIA